MGIIINNIKYDKQERGASMEVLTVN